MKQFRVGDEVRVARLFSSPWQNASGTIVEILDRKTSDGKVVVQECAVTIRGSRRWFLAEHLDQTVCDKFVRFFRAEVLDRWHLDANDIGHLNGDREQLVDFLRDSFNFAIRRAEAEVDAFYVAFNSRIASAVESPSKENSPSKTAA